MRKNIFTFILALLLLSSDADGAGAGQPVIFSPTVNQFSQTTKVLTNHQGNHLIERCYVVADGSALVIHFPMSAAYHLQLSFVVQGKEFDTILDWQPVSNERVENRILSQKLYLGKEEYSAGDILHGYLELEFFSRVVGTGAGKAVKYSVKGPFFAVVRPSGFDPLLDSNIATYSQTVAENELPMLHDAYTLQWRGGGASWLPEHMDDYDLGSPLECYNNQLQAVRDEFLKSVQVQPGQGVLQELTWDINPSAPFGDGPERLTIWFAERDGEWEQVGFKKWFYDYCMDNQN